MKNLKLSALLCVLCASAFIGHAQTAPILFPANSLFGGAALGKTLQLSAVNTLISDGQNIWAGSYINVPYPGSNPVVNLYPNDYLLTVPGVIKPARFTVYGYDVGTNIIDVTSRLTSGPLFYFGTNGFANLVSTNGIVLVTNTDRSISVGIGMVPPGAASAASWGATATVSPWDIGNYWWSAGEPFAPYYNYSAAGMIFGSGLVALDDAGEFPTFLCYGSIVSNCPAVMVVSWDNLPMTYVSSTGGMLIGGRDFPAAQITNTPDEGCLAVLSNLTVNGNIDVKGFPRIDSDPSDHFTVYGKNGDALFDNTTYQIVGAVYLEHWAKATNLDVAVYGHVTNGICTWTTAP